MSQLFAQAPHARTHARTPGMPLGVLEALRAAEPGQGFAGHGAPVFGGVAALAGRSLVQPTSHDWLLCGFNGPAPFVSIWAERPLPTPQYP